MVYSYNPEQKTYEYIVIGTGTAGCVVASRLAEKGLSVCAIEAGKDYNDLYSKIPFMQLYAAIDPEITWDFFVKHYDKKKQADNDPNYHKHFNGILYPRASCIGGCSEHHNLIALRNPDSDWDKMAKRLDDCNWDSTSMNIHWKKAEKDYLYFRNSASDPLYLFRAELNFLVCTYSFVIWSIFFKINQYFSKLMGLLLKTQIREFVSYIFTGLYSIFIDSYNGLSDGNKLSRSGNDGFIFLPGMIYNGERIGPKVLFKKTEARYKNLKVMTDTFVTKILFDDSNSKAIGVECVSGQHLYGAHVQIKKGTKSEPFILNATREVILCGGVFNSPQVLMLSGIGKEGHLKEHSIQCIKDLPVGNNLQDRYEQPVIFQHDRDFAPFDNIHFDPGSQRPDAELKIWLESRKGLYARNLVSLAVLYKSNENKDVPDNIMVWQGGSQNSGYFFGWPQVALSSRNRSTWLNINCYANQNGKIRLKSNDPFDTPDINMNHFDNNKNDDNNWIDDMNSCISAIKHIRKLNKAIDWQTEKEILPGDNYKDDKHLAEYIKDVSWGHHACCSVPIGDCLETDFRVKGFENLRVIDASSFDEIPGYFISVPTMILAEKGAVDILQRHYKFTGQHTLPKEFR